MEVEGVTIRLFGLMLAIAGPAGLPPTTLVAEPAILTVYSGLK
jgi:hypothetical protein